MSQPKEFYLSTSEAQANISKMIKFMEDQQDHFIITRYSKPVGVFIPFSQYQQLKEEAKRARGGVCQNCNL
jgi:prevent-host-death family protein